MIDDLTLQGVTEPYRMLTARAEYRLRLRADNADTRLTPQAIAAGCVTPERARHFHGRRDERDSVETLFARAYTARELADAGIALRDDGVRRSLAEWLRFPEVDSAAVRRLVPELAGCSTAAVEEVIQDCRYAPYVARQQSEIARFKADEDVGVPSELDFGTIAGLSTEMVERLMKARPATLGAASRIRGITPAALAAILVHCRRKAA
jgi:tRNA uridine 5-carboxymethylaminomethyl modification enzyme